MAKERHLNRAPIREAVVDLRVSATAFDASTLERLRQAFAKDFPDCEEQRHYETLIDISHQGVAQATRHVGRGYVCRSPEHHSAVTISPSGFSYSRLRPYTEWETVVAEARNNWDVYADIVRVETIDRLGVRFINQFTVPRSRRIDEYLTVSPPLPETFTHQDSNGSLMRLFLAGAGGGITARLTQVVEPSDVGTSVILDSDSFTSPDGKLDDSIWEQFGELRIMKNRLFFGSLTGLAVEDFA